MPRLPVWAAVIGMTMLNGSEKIPIFQPTVGEQTEVAKVAKVAKVAEVAKVAKVANKAAGAAAVMIRKHRRLPVLLRGGLQLNLPKT